MAVLELPEFADRLAAHLEVDSTRRDERASIFEDWVLDSLRTFQLIVVVEAMAGVAVPPASIPEMYSIGDVYGYYRSLVDGAAA